MEAAGSLDEGYVYDKARNKREINDSNPGQFRSALGKVKKITNVKGSQ